MIYKAASFFSGVGGLDLAFAWAGFDIQLHVEIDSYCRKILHKNRAYWPNAKQKKDIRHVTKTEVGNPHVMFGGFPCQDISIAGKRGGLTKSNRSGLWFEFLRLIKQVRPHVVVLENVAAVHVPTIDEHGNEQPAPALIVLATLSEVGYDAIWFPVRASDIGAPHQRERWFCVAYRTTDGRGKMRILRTLQKSDRRKLGNRKSQRLQKGSKSYTERAKRFSVSSVAPRGATKLDNTCDNQLQRRQNPASIRGGRAQTEQFTGRSGDSNRRTSRPQSRLGRVAHGFSARVDRHQSQWPARPNESQYDYEPSRVTGRKENRVDRIKALGNAVVPQQAYPIALAVKQFLDETIAA
jgi:DNA (cytosine-5)-methyltransferase 1